MEEKKEEEEEEEEKILDTNWIDEFKMYEGFYLDDLHEVKINCVYVDRDNNIVKVKEENYKMQKPNHISREEIIGILKQRTVMETKKYNVLTILKYNVDTDPVDVINVKKKCTDNFLSSIKNIDSVVFSPSIHMFHELNQLYFIFYEKTSSKRGKTKRVYINNKNKHAKTLHNRNDNSTIEY